MSEYSYEDIIHLPHHVSARHPQMPLADRAAQFSPFAALNGHEAAIRETARLTKERVELDESRKEILDERLQMIRENLSEKPEVTFTYFQPDERKSGGAYLTVTGRVKKMDGYERRILLEDGTVVPLEELIDIELFSNGERNF